MTFERTENGSLVRFPRMLRTWRQPQFDLNDNSVFHRHPLTPIRRPRLASRLPFKCLRMRVIPSHWDFFPILFFEISLSHLDIQPEYQWMAMINHDANTTTPCRGMRTLLKSWIARFSVFLDTAASFPPPHSGRYYQTRQKGSEFIDA